MYTIAFLKVRAFQLSKRHISTIHNLELLYTIAFLKVRTFQLSKRHISTIHNLESCTPSHSSKYELFNCPNVISQQSTILESCTPSHSSKYETFQLSKPHISTCKNTRMVALSVYYAKYLMWCIKVNIYEWKGNCWDMTFELISDM